MTMDTEGSELALVLDFPWDDFDVRIDPDNVHTPGIFVQRLFKASNLEKRIEQRTVREAA